MSTPLVSVILPAYNGADTIGGAIRSVLEQTYSRWELLVTDDCSTDRTCEAVRRFTDPRVRLLEHRANQGPDAARLTALAASNGDLVAFLDQDDLFLPGKLAAHVAFMGGHPDVGLSYNPFFLVTEPGKRIQLISRPPVPITLADLVIGFPLPPSTWVFRRQWALFDEIWDPETMLRGREVVLLGRLLVAGCRFGLVDEVLNQRRIHLGRRFGAPALKCAEERRCQDIMLADQRCDEATRGVKDLAATNAWLMWANVALAQGDTAVGRDLLRQALALAPDLATGTPHRLADYFLGHAVIEAADAEAQLRRVFAHAAAELPDLMAHLDWAVGQAHLILAARHVLWGRAAEATAHWSRVRALGATPDDSFLRRLVHEVLSFERLEGEGPARKAVDDLARALALLGEGGAPRRLRGMYRLSRAFLSYGRGHRASVPGDVVRGLLSDPREMSNRGAWSILVRSALAR